MRANTFTQFILLLLGSIYLPTTVMAKTFTLKSAGKWNNTEIWSPYSPALELIKYDTVIIDKSVILNEDLTINGLIVVKESGSLMGNKSLDLQKDAVFINEGHTVVKSLVNRGYVNNLNMFETTGDVENHGLLNNNESFISGGFIQNMGGTILGINGQFYAGQSITNSDQGFISSRVELLTNGQSSPNTKDATTAKPKPSGIKVNVNVVETKVNLQVVNSDYSDVRSVRLEKSADGLNYDLISTLLTVNNQLEYNFEDNMSSARCFYRVKVYLRNGQCQILPLVMVEGKDVNEMDNAGLSLGIRY